MKRIFDFTIALGCLVMASPLFLLVALLIQFRLGNPILFNQLRPGLNTKPITIYKFRTMTDERDQKGELLPDHLRLTALGKFIRKYSLDELPQLMNVLKGDLSLVGPRPLLMEYLPLYSPFQARRHEVKPGITGWAQVNGRNALSWEEKFELDVWYVENQSFLLDLKILFLTFKKVVISDGINHEGHETMPKFVGSYEMRRKNS